MIYRVIRRSTTRDTVVWPTLTLLLPLVFLTPFAVAQPVVSHTNRTDSIEVCVPYSSGWNIVSNPVLRAPDTDSIWQVFCGQGSCFYRWGYPQCTAPNGMGLWLKVVNHPSVCCIDGEAIAQDTIPVTAAWNLIGTISYPVAVSSIQSIPPNLVVSKVFQFSGRYVQADTLRPGFGYWVKASGAGQLVLSSAF